jgi:hypothetical protein
MTTIRNDRAPAARREVSRAGRSHQGTPQSRDCFRRGAELWGGAPLDEVYRGFELVETQRSIRTMMAFELYAWHKSDEPVGL